MFLARHVDSGLGLAVVFFFIPPYSAFVRPNRASQCSQAMKSPAGNGMSWKERNEEQSKKESLMSYVFLLQVFIFLWMDLLPIHLKALIRFGICSILQLCKKASASIHQTRKNSVSFSTHMILNFFRIEISHLTKQGLKLKNYGTTCWKM